MISSLFLSQYVDFRLSFANQVELYLIDQIQENQFEVLIKDDGISLEGDELTSANEKLNKLQLKSPDKYYQYFHKGKNNLQIDVQYTKAKISLNDLILLDY